MSLELSDDVLDERDQRLVAALQCDGRVTAERAADVLGLSPRVVHRRWAALLGSGTVRVAGLPPRDELPAAMTLRIKVLRGKADVIAKALADRDDIPFADLSASGDEIGAILLADPGSPHRLVFRQLPATGAVTSVDAQTILHVFKYAHEWRHDVLSAAERAALTPPPASCPSSPPDATDLAILTALADDGRSPATALARLTGHPESTVRRRVSALRASGLLRTQVHVDARRVGLMVDANLLMQVAPGELDAVGRRLAAHPAVHGAFATTGVSNLHLAVWLRGLPELYRFITGEVGVLGVSAVETVLVGRAVKRR
ncbi:Lrp/AsnC family transcriptional regulator [Streptomyces sp. I05A-00742]|uniref:Lrp/AsnC family transcriptional regulator n=1 Tax=Streptomyces sp. I05A-00742 TaxID=2732853 RepID=UPI00148811E0|nr:Lrp/AsnC family transcriptional regulator [Streptomyces sp. I05A-00742]